MEQSHIYILRDIDLMSISIYDLMRNLSSQSTHVDFDGYRLIYPLHISVNEGFFTKESPSVAFPNVSVVQEGRQLTLICSCNCNETSLCSYQLEILFALRQLEDFRVFFDDKLRNSRLREFAKDYGLESEEDLDDYFHLVYERGKAVVKSNKKELFAVDRSFLQSSRFTKNVSNDFIRTLGDDKSKWLLVLHRHKLYDQLTFSLYEGERTRIGKLKNPLNAVDIPGQLLLEGDMECMRFLSAVLSCQNRFDTAATPTEIELLKFIVANPLGLEVFYHEGRGNDKITAQSLFPVKLVNQRPELKLTVLRKEAFYEVSSYLYISDKILPIADLVLKNEGFILLNGLYIYVPDQDLLRVICFLKTNGPTILIHRNKFEAFKKQFLTSIEDYVQIDYDDIYIASDSDYEETMLSSGIDRALFLQKEGAYITITPVVNYGGIEIPVYSKKQLYLETQDGRMEKRERDYKYEEDFVSLVVKQHVEFEEQLLKGECFYLHADKFFDDDWFLASFDKWRNEGVAILGFEKLDGNRLNPHKADVDIKVHSGKDWFNVHVKVDFAGQLAKLKELQRAFRNRSRFVRLDDGSLGIIPEEWLSKISKYFSFAILEKELLHIPKTRFSEIESVFEQEVLAKEVRVEIDLFKTVFVDDIVQVAVPVPQYLRAKLRDYQCVGFRWLCQLDRFNFGGCLADDMGLGKTVQVIAFLLYLKDKNKSSTNLIVLPTSLLFNWEEELEKFAPDLNVLVYVGHHRKQDTVDFREYDVILISYGVLISDLNVFKKQTFEYIFLDEAQLIKNPNSERYKAVCMLKSRNRIALTGTPIENSTFDIYGLFSFINPGFFGNKQFFKDTYAIPIDQFDYDQRMIELEQKIKPFVLRRTKRQVAKELPDKYETTIYCEMGDGQRRLYLEYEEEVRSYLNSTSLEKLDMDPLHVLSSITRLRQICNSPSLLNDLEPQVRSVKIEVLLEQIMGKIRDHKILVFSQFVGMLEIIKAKLEEKGVPYTYLTGETKDRKSIVNEFQTNSTVRVFLLSLKVGGVGLNLTEADYVYLIDPWWNPAVENQAIDRVYRIGQKKKVTAIRLICANTIEEKIMQLQKKKQQLAGNLVTTDQSWIKDLSKEELLHLLSSGY